MADITMCDGKEGPMKENCYRFTATPDEYRQSYFMKEPVILHIEEGKHWHSCNHFWNNEDYRK